MDTTRDQKLQALDLLRKAAFDFRGSAAQARRRTKVAAKFGRGAMTKKEIRETFFDAFADLSMARKVLASALKLYDLGISPEEIREFHSNTSRILRDLRAATVSEIERNELRSIAHEISDMLVIARDSAASLDFRAARAKKEILEKVA